MISTTNTAEFFVKLNVLQKGNRKSFKLHTSEISGKNRWKQVKIVKTIQAIFVHLEFWRGCGQNRNCKPGMRWNFCIHSISSSNDFSICCQACNRIFFKVLDQKFDWMLGCDSYFIFISNKTKTSEMRLTHSFLAAATAATHAYLHTALPSKRLQPTFTEHALRKKARL